MQNLYKISSCIDRRRIVNKTVKSNDPTINAGKCTDNHTYCSDKHICNQFVSSIKVQEIQIKEDSESLRSSLFKSSVLHGLRMLLKRILNFLGLTFTPRNGAQANSYGAIVHAGAKALHDIVDTFFEIEAGKSGVHHGMSDLRKLCESVAEIHNHRAKSKGLVLSVNYEENLPAIIYTDCIKLIFILNTLLHNAVKFTTQGGIFFHISKNQNYWVFRITDSGRGMNQSEVDSLFDHFRYSEINELRATRKYGRRLGVSLCKELPEFLGGRIDIFSELHIGTSSEVWIPLHASAADRPLALKDEPS